MVYLGDPNGIADPRERETCRLRMRVKFSMIILKIEGKNRRVDIKALFPLMHH